VVTAGGVNHQHFEESVILRTDGLQGVAEVRTPHTAHNNSDELQNDFRELLRFIRKRYATFIPLA